MQATHHATHVPLFVRQILDRRKGLGNTGIEKDVQIDTTNDHDPVKEPAERAEMMHRIVRRREGSIENPFDALKTIA